MKPFRLARREVLRIMEVSAPCFYSPLTLLWGWNRQRRAFLLAGLGVTISVLWLSS